LLLLSQKAGKHFTKKIKFVPFALIKGKEVVFSL